MMKNEERIKWNINEMKYLKEKERKKEIIKH